jgi:hypothetical protein
MISSRSDNVIFFMDRKKLVIENSIPQNGMDQKPNIKIKLEVDNESPLGFGTEEKLLLKPFSFYVKCFSLPDLFAGHR